MTYSDKSGRRQFLRTIATRTVGLSAASLGLGMSGIALVEADSPSQTWEKSDEESHTTGGWSTSLAHSTSVGWYGASYDHDKEAWGHDFRLSSTASARHTDYGSELDRIDAHYSGVREGTTDYLYAAVSSDHHGVWPRVKEDTYDHSDLMFDLAKKAITTLSAYADFALTAADLADKLIPDAEPVDTNEFAYLDRWEYNTEHSDVSHYRLYDAYCGSDESVFDIETQATDSGFGLEPQTTFTFHVQGNNSPDEGKITGTTVKTTPAGTTLYRPKPGWLVERIPYEKIPTRAEAFGWPDQRIQRHLDNGGRPLYFAHRAPVKLLD